MSKGGAILMCYTHLPFKGPTGHSFLDSVFCFFLFWGRGDEISIYCAAWTSLELEIPLPQCPEC